MISSYRVLVDNITLKLINKKSIKCKRFDIINISESDYDKFSHHVPKLLEPINESKSILISTIEDIYISKSKLSIETEFDVGVVNGVWFSKDVKHKGPNYFKGGNIHKNIITLGKALPFEDIEMLVSYTTMGAIIKKDANKRHFHRKFHIDNNITSININRKVIGTIPDKITMSIKYCNMFGRSLYSEEFIFNSISDSIDQCKLYIPLIEGIRSYEISGVLPLVTNDKYSIGLNVNNMIGE